MKLVNIIWAMHFLVVSLTPHTDLCELRELPKVFDHYQEHKLAAGDSFLEYLTEDYLSFKSSERQHHADDDNLPFHGHLNHSHCCSFTIFRQEQGFSWQSDFRKTELPTYNFIANTAYLNSIFQPPQV
ncbi:hypothetical protein [Fulvivirga ligni]|uniref:hypothetical protein n=1 Tax=Fulvivirga ligni TaxID=2904246 RepID=UPI001F448180|nr:hypothetical protein [Fulvivirga ligni]UII23163.1 hypothetical protein LVD16_07980 [Fulvivirga ligni]